MCRQVVARFVSISHVVANHLLLLCTTYCHHDMENENEIVIFRTSLHAIKPCHVYPKHLAWPQLLRRWCFYGSFRSNYRNLASNSAFLSTILSAHVASCLFVFASPSRKKLKITWNKNSFKYIV